MMKFNLVDVHTYKALFTKETVVMSMSYQSPQINNLSDAYRALSKLWNTNDFYFNTDTHWESGEKKHFPSIHNIMYKGVRVGWVSYGFTNTLSVPSITLLLDDCHDMKLSTPTYEKVCKQEDYLTRRKSA